MRTKFNKPHEANMVGGGGGGVGSGTAIEERQDLQRASRSGLRVGVVADARTAEMKEAAN
jgi:hypothetical protein